MRFGEARDTEITEVFRRGPAGQTLFSITAKGRVSWSASWWLLCSPSRTPPSPAPRFGGSPKGMAGASSVPASTGSFLGYQPAERSSAAGIVPRRAPLTSSETLASSCACASLAAPDEAPEGLELGLRESSQRATTVPWVVTKPQVSPSSNHPPVGFEYQTVTQYQPELPT